MNEEVLTEFNKQQFQQDLLSWYYQHKRDLPWRQDQDPYKVWVSEIMLQQTKVDTVIPYFYRFIDKYPTVYDLAAADEQEVLKAWEGLGYYSRAKNLQTAVREVVASYGGVVPANPKELGSLKGIGPYTRGAILSIAYNQPEPAVDGNVMRVISRILKIEEDIAKVKTRNIIEKEVREIISKDDPASFNQAIMDLGSSICTPKAPACTFCPIQEHCRAYADGVQDELPIKSKAKKQKKIPYIALLIKNENNEYVIEQRQDSGLLANLWQFPMVPIDEVGRKDLENWVFSEYGLKVKIKEHKGNLKHVFSHIIWQLEIYEAETINVASEDQRLRFVNIHEIKGYPFPVSHQKMMKYLSE
ncbi:A/G-specific adenine glycosylase [Oceanobacillus chungangensis]|uniref:Adenine DNA glycosylase n=1 Tax=Oceanobacillus chungangensis TaxID=1229152 RepID=A0A3D8PN95_9BACI|nr:A/G-specific adenine glycosylase [Oceanobacillus chungangensis]RDW17444.1 A/G-specific adenine glycosylase [Oceanobacillus chungangensis]